jgi:hypothetical protein
MMKKMTWAYLFTHFGYNDSIKKIAILFWYWKSLTQ